MSQQVIFPRHDGSLQLGQITAQGVQTDIENWLTGLEALAWCYERADKPLFKMIESVPLSVRLSLLLSLLPAEAVGLVADLVSSLKGWEERLGAFEQAAAGQALVRRERAPASPATVRSMLRQLETEGLVAIDCSPGKPFQVRRTALGDQWVAQLGQLVA